MSTTPTLDPWPALAARLGPAALEAMARQGFVSAETRPSGRTTYKLRWRKAAASGSRTSGPTRTTRRPSGPGWPPCQAPRPPPAW